MTPRFIILTLIALMFPQTGTGQTTDNYTELLAKVRHISNGYGGGSNQSDEAATIVLGKLCNGYTQPLTRQQQEVLCNLIQPMLERATEEVQRRQLAQALEHIKNTGDRPDLQQRILDYYQKVPQERIHLHTDKPYYAAGDTIWFRAHLVDAVTNIPVARSKYVYVELHDQQADTLVGREMVKCDSDMVFANAMPLPRTLHSGSYMLTAYTQWMRNFGAERFFYQPLWVTGNGETARGDAEETTVGAPSNDTRTAPACPTDTLLEVAQRNGCLLVKPHLPQPSSYACAIYGSGNLMIIEQLTGKTMRIDTHTLQDGYVSIALIETSSSRVLTERKVLIDNQRATTVRLEGQAALPHEEMTLTLHVTDSDGQPLPGTYSVSVADGGVVAADASLPGIEQTLRTPNSGYSLAQMLAKKYPTIRHNIEADQTISGRIRTTFKKYPKDMKLLFVSPSTGEKHTIELGDSNRFCLRHLDFVNGTPFVLQAVRQNGSDGLVQLHIDSPTFPRIAMPSQTASARP